MRKKAAGILALSMLLLIAMTAIVAAQENPVEGYFQSKLLPFAQSLATIVAVLYLIFGGMKFLKSDDPAEKDKGIKILIGVAIAVALVWLAPAIVDFLKPG